MKDKQTFNIYGAIDRYSFWGFEDACKNASKELVINLDSKGGCADTMIKFVECIKEAQKRGVKVICNIFGYSASAAAVIAASSPSSSSGSSTRLG